MFADPAMQQTQPTCNSRSGSRTQDTAIGGDYHLCGNLRSTLQAAPFCFHTEKKALHESCQGLTEHALAVA